MPTTSSGFLTWAEIAVIEQLAVWQASTACGWQCLSMFAKTLLLSSDYRLFSRSSCVASITKSAERTSKMSIE